MDPDDYDRELARRLRIIEEPGYDDPARRDVPRFDVALLVVGTVLLVVAMWLWGAPA